ncbi:unnamed protein product [Larinioides sclopetarius]|uniref:ATP synthase F0 subunit 8 n=1 Tax=Larinioides sclopetarius TaxID=280406 RepID=A0AAV1ZBG2_9ARAC
MRLCFRWQLSLIFIFMLLFLLLLIKRERFLQRPPCD